MIFTSEIKGDFLKGFYLFAPVEPGVAGPESGVERKVRAQHKALSQYLDCELVILPPVEYTGSRAEKIIRRLPLTAAWRKWKYKGEFDGADFIYIRQVYHDASFTRYMREIRRRNPNMKIIYEIPTYPYDNETSRSLARLPFDMKERVNRIRAAKYMDRIVTFYGQKEIWGIPCICIMNGYDFSAVRLPDRKHDGTIHLVSVSATAPWHGYDRLIAGMYEYYQNGGTENIVFHMVGNVIPEHREMVEKYGLQEHVIFYGRLPADKLGTIYQKATLGVDILAGHRRDSKISSTLKSREYGAYGLPILTACPVDYLPEDYKYLILVPDGEDALDMKGVIEAYHKIYDNQDCSRSAEEIRTFAQSRCDMNITMKPVADWLIGEK